CVCVYTVCGVKLLRVCAIRLLKAPILSLAFPLCVNCTSHNNTALERERLNSPIWQGPGRQVWSSLSHTHTHTHIHTHTHTASHRILACCCLDRQRSDLQQIRQELI